MADLQAFTLAHYSHALGVMNRREMNRDELAELARLGPVGVFVQAALTDNPFCLWQGDEPSAPFITRQGLAISYSSEF